jgi:hypothetical protein
MAWHLSTAVTLMPELSPMTRGDLDHASLRINTIAGCIDDRGFQQVCEHAIRCDKDALVLAYLENRNRDLWDYLSHPTPPKDLRVALTNFE